MGIPKFTATSSFRYQLGNFQIEGNSKIHVKN